MKRIGNRVLTTVAAVVLLAAGMAGGLGWARRQGAADAGDGDAAGSVAAGQPEVLYWYDPMVPDQRFDRPGKSPFMDMQLVPKYADEEANGGVRIDPGLQQSVGIRTAVVETGALAAMVRVPATLAWDLRQESVVSARAEGLISRVQVKAPYTKVARGAALATIVAPAWSSALGEARALQQARSSAARELQAAARQRLHALGVPGGTDGDGGVTFSAPRDGIVTEVLVREGQTVMPGAPLFRINGTGTLWVEAAVPQSLAIGLRAGTPAEAVVDAVPGHTFRGEVEALLPQVDAASRTQTVRIVLRNPGDLLAPGMFAEVRLSPQAGQRLPWVPTEALIATGIDSRVIVQADDGGFRPVRVRTGRSDGGRIEVLSGLTGGERVVVSGQFLIDSEASLSGALQRLNDAPAASGPTTPAMPEIDGNTQEAGP